MNNNDMGLMKAAIKVMPVDLEELPLMPGAFRMKAPTGDSERRRAKRLGGLFGYRGSASLLLLRPIGS